MSKDRRQLSSAHRAAPILTLSAAPTAARIDGQARNRTRPRGKYKNLSTTVLRGHACNSAGHCTGRVQLQLVVIRYDTSNIHTMQSSHRPANAEGLWQSRAASFEKMRGLHTSRRPRSSRLTMLVVAPLCGQCRPGQVRIRTRLFQKVRRYTGEFA